MKIGEVLEKTGLTDRAVRLYIEHGLITPSIEKSYSGRKSFVFSDEDVEKLRRISILRKADFSIAQIGRIDGGGEDAAAAFSEFMEYKREKHTADAEIIDALEKFSGDVTLESVAVALEVGGADKMENADMMPTKEEIREKRIFAAIGVVVVVVSSLCMLMSFAIATRIIDGYEHPYWDFSVAILHLILNIPSIITLILGIIVIKKNRKVVKFYDSDGRRVNSVVCLALAAFSIVFLLRIQLIVAVVVPITHSQTSDIEDYLVLDDWVEKFGADYINSLFPPCVPAEVNAEYYYKYNNWLESEFEIVAQWELTDEAIEEEIKKIEYIHPDAKIFEKGEYTCVAVKGMDDGDVKSNWVTLLFAYNDETGEVRYIFYYSIEHITTPYFETLDW